MHCYCLFCHTQKARSIAEIITSSGVASAFSPHIFLFADEAIEAFTRIRHLPGVIRILGNRDDGYELSGADLAFAKMLYGSNGAIGILKAFEEGEKVRLDRSLFGDFEGRIVKFDRGRKRAQIEFDFDGIKRSVWCGVDMIRPTKAQ